MSNSRTSTRPLHPRSKISRLRGKGRTQKGEKATLREMATNRVGRPAQVPIRVAVGRADEGMARAKGGVEEGRAKEKMEMMKMEKKPQKEEKELGMEAKAKAKEGTLQNRCCQPQGNSWLDSAEIVVTTYASHSIYSVSPLTTPYSLLWPMPKGYGRNLALQKGVILTGSCMSCYGDLQLIPFTPLSRMQSAFQRNKRVTSKNSTISSSLPSTTLPNIALQEYAQRRFVASSQLAGRVGLLRKRVRTGSGYSSLTPTGRRPGKHMKRQQRSRKHLKATSQSNFARTQDPGTTSNSSSRTNLQVSGYETQKVPYKWLRNTRAAQKVVHAMNGNSTNEEAQQSNYRMKKISRVGQLFIYTDGSLQNGIGGWAVVVEGQQNSWGVVPEGITISGSTTTELFAIQQALVRIASSRSWEKPLAITIFSDSAEAIKFSLGLHSPSTGTSDSMLCDSITIKLDELELHHSVTLKWLKAHAGIEGNELADKLADLAVRVFIQEKKGSKEAATQNSLVLPVVKSQNPTIYPVEPLHLPLLKTFPQSRNLEELAEAIWDTFSKAGETKHLEADQPMGRAWNELKKGGVIRSPGDVSKLTQGTNLCLKYIRDKPSRIPATESKSTQLFPLSGLGERGLKRPSSTSPNRPAKTQSHCEKLESYPTSEEVQTIPNFRISGFR